MKMAKTLFELKATEYDFPDEYPSDEEAGSVTVRFLFDRTQVEAYDLIEEITMYTDQVLSDEYGVIKAEQIDE